MPAVAAALFITLRWIVIAVVQSVIFTALINALEPLMDKLKEVVKNTFGLSDGDAGTYVANFILDSAELAGLTVASLKTKIPVKVADKFGLTARGFKRGALPAKVSTGANAPGTMAKAATDAGTPTAAVAAEAISKTRGISLSTINESMSVILKVASIPLGILYVIPNIIDFGAWSGSAYQGTFQPILSVFGLKPDANFAKATTVSDDVWNRVYNTYLNLGAYAIEDPYKMQSVVFSKQALIDLVNKIGAELNASTGSAPAKAVLAATHALVLIKGQAPTTPAASSAQVVGGGGSTSTVVAQPRVFTGVLSQGVLGAGLQFTARPDDLIESVQELQDAASNNLAAAVAALPASLTYEIKIVSSVITKDGFKQTGATQQIVTGYNKDGSPKTKSVTNKFATLNIYLLNEKGTRTKVRSIILGPTNVLKFNPTSGQLTGVTDSVKTTLVTSNPADITSVVSSTPSTSSPASTPSPTTTEPYTVGKQVRGGAANSKGDILFEYTYKGGGKWQVGDTFHGIYDNTFKTTAELLAMGVNLSAAGSSEPATITNITSIGNNTSSVPSGATPIAAEDDSTHGGEVVRIDGQLYELPGTATPKGINATNLSEYYAARGQSLPSLAQRAQIYANLGLGQASLYAGTAEQNTKLLNALKAQF